MLTETTVLEQLQTDQTPFWYLYESGGTKAFRVSGDTADIDVSVQRLTDTLAQLAPGTYRLKAAESPNKHNGAKWHDLTIGARNAKPNSGRMTGSTNAYGIPDNVLKQIQEETRQKFMFEDMYAEFKQFRAEWPEYKKKVDKMEKYLSEDLDGDGIPDFAQTVSSVAKSVEGINTVKKVFTGSSLYD